MAQLVLGAAGAVVGTFLGGPVGGSIGWAIGSSIGSQFGPKQSYQGPRLSDLKVTSGQYGDPIPWVMGHPRVAGQVWWASDRREISETSETGKGGGGASTTTYTYEVDVLFGLTDTVIVDVSRIWLNGKLVYVSLDTADPGSIENSVDNPNWEALTVYTGAADQLPDPVYEAAVGVGNAPAYRGRGTVMIEGLQLGGSGVIPNLTFEIATGQGPADSSVLLHGVFTEALTDTSCNELGDAEFGVTPPLGTFSDDGYTFEQDQDGSGSGVKAFGWQDESLRMDGAVETTVECLFEVGNSTFIVGEAEIGIVVFSIGRNISLNNYAYYFFADPFDGTILANAAGSGNSTPVSGLVRGTRHHIAICFPSAPSAGDPVRFYFDGVEMWTRPNKGSLDNLVDAIGLGGQVPAVPTQTSTTVTYHGVQVTRGILYPDGDSFDPPETFDPPICAPSTSLENATLQETVEALAARCDIDEAGAWDYDATALATITKPVRAIAVAQVVPTRSVLEQLQAAYFFDFYGTDKLYAVPRGGAVAAALEFDDLGVGTDGPDAEALPMQIGSGDEIPAQVSVTYANFDSDYNQATEISDRLLTGQVNTSALQIPMTFISSEAKGIADAVLLDGYASRVSGSLSLSLAHARLVPTDVVTVPDADGNVFRVRLVRRTDEANLLRFEWVLDDVSTLESAGITSDDYTPVIDVALPGDSDMELLDIPLLRDSEDYLGHYVAASSSSDSWPGASIQRSLDDVEYLQAAVVNERAVMGIATTELGDFSGGVVFDETNTVTVNVGIGTLSSSTRAAMLADASVNLIAVGDELIRFRTATLINQGIYSLSGLLRGQKGTEWAMGAHAGGEPVVLLRTQGLRYVRIDLPSVGAERWYKGVTKGAALSSATSEAFTSEAASLKPLAPVNLRRTVGPANEVTLTWDRRTRLACSFTGASGVSVPLGEASEAYEVNVVLIAGSVLKRTISASSASAVYTAAMQTADGIGAGTPIRFDVYQISAVIGRGYAGSLTTAGSVTPQPQITRLTVGGSFASGAALYATLAGVTYNYTSVGGDTNLAGIATSFAAVIDAAAAYAAAAVGAAIDVTGPVSIAFPVVVGVTAGDNTTTWALTQTASPAVAGVGNQIYFGWKNLSDPAGANAYPFGMNFNLLIQRIDPPLNLFYSVTNADAGGFTDYRILPGLIGAIGGEVRGTGDDVTYGFSLTSNDVPNGTSTLTTPASEPYNWSLQVSTNIPAVSGLAANSARGVTPAALRPQIVTLTLAGTPATGRIYRATLGGVNLDYTAGGGDTTMALVATGLAAVIDANADYLASAVGAVITITHANNNVPFTYSSTVIGSTVTLTAANTQEAS